MEKRATRSSEREAFRLIEDMLQLMESRGLVELEIEQEGIRVRLKKATAAAPQIVEYVSGAPPAPAASVGASKAADAAGNRVVIKSPMVGTFYRAPAPDAPAFVDAGQEIEAGQVVCIVEAMKLMNEIKSETAGKILEVLVDNGEPVEFGQPLFAVEPR